MRYLWVMVAARDNLQYLKNMSSKRFLIKWKENCEDEVSWELENKFKETYPNFVIKDNDFIWEGKRGNGILSMMKNCTHGCPRLRNTNEENSMVKKLDNN